MNVYQMSPADRVAYCGQLIESMREMTNPTKPKTAATWTPERSAQINQIAQTVRVTGGKLRLGVLRNGSN